MTVYRLTGIGQSLGSTPNLNDIPTLKVVNFLRRNGYEATDEMITAHTGVEKYDLSCIAKNVKVIRAVG